MRTKLSKYSRYSPTTRSRRSKTSNVTTDGSNRCQKRPALRVLGTRYQPQKRLEGVLLLRLGNDPINEFICVDVVVMGGVVMTKRLIRTLRMRITLWWPCIECPPGSGHVAARREFVRNPVLNRSCGSLG